MYTSSLGVGATRNLRLYHEENALPWYTGRLAWHNFGRPEPFAFLRFHSFGICFCNLLWVSYSEKGGFRSRFLFERNIEVPNTKLFLQDLQQNYPYLIRIQDGLRYWRLRFLWSAGVENHMTRNQRGYTAVSQAAIFEFGGGTCLFTRVFSGRISYTVAKKAQTSNICEHHVTNGSVTV